MILKRLPYSLVLLTFLLFCGPVLKAQYTEIINSNRPGKARSPFTVGKNVFQLQMGANGGAYGRSNDAELSYFAGFNPSFRFGFTEKLELSWDLQTRSDWNNAQQDSSFTYSGLSRNTIGLTYNIYEGKNWIPAVGVYAGVNTNLIADEYKSNHLSPVVSILTQNDLSRFNFVTTWTFDWKGTSQRPVFIADPQNPEPGAPSYINMESPNGFNFNYFMSLTQAISLEWAWFVEHYGAYRPSYESPLDLGINAGAAYLIHSNLQLDAILGTNFFFDRPTYFVGIGLSWRIAQNDNNYYRSRNRSNRNSDLPSEFRRIDPRAY